jgi:replication factor A1
MAAAALLTPETVAVITDADVMGPLQLVLQVVDVRLANNNSAALHFWMVLSNGVYTLESVLAAAENPRVWDSSVQKGSIIRLRDFTCSTIVSRR